MKREQAISHYETLYPEFIEDLEYFNDEYEADNAGRSDVTRSKLSRCTRWVGILSYLVDGDVKRFRQLVSQSAQLKLEQYQCFDRGEVVDPSYVALLGGYTAVLHALSASDFGLAVDLADTIGGRELIEQEHDHPSDRALGYVLKSFVGRGNIDMRSDSLASLRAVASDEYARLADFFECLLARDTEGLNNAFEEFLSHYVNSAETGGRFADDLGDAISLVGIALANYACHCGFDFSPNSPYIPSGLIVGS